MAIYRVAVNDFLILVRVESEDQIKRKFEKNNDSERLMLKLRDFDENFKVDLDLTDKEVNFEYHIDWLMDAVPFQSNARVNISCIDCVEEIIGNRQFWKCKNLFIRKQAARVDKGYQVLTACCKRFPKSFLMELKEQNMTRKEKYGDPAIISN